MKLSMQQQQKHFKKLTCFKKKSKEKKRIFGLGKEFEGRRKKAPNITAIEALVY